MSGELPEGWSRTTLGEQTAKMVGGGTPPRNEPRYWNGAIPWASVKDLRSAHLELTEESITPEGIQASASNVIPAGTIIIATRMAVGKAVRFSKDVAINQDLRAIYPKPSMDSAFLHHWLRWKESDLSAVATGTTVKGIRQEIIRDWPLLLPPLAEQHRIAEILSSVDEAIQTTQSVIEQLEKARTTALRRLFPLDLNKLSEKFADWSVQAANQVTKAIIDCKNRTPPRSETGFPVVRTPNVRNGKFIRQGLHYTDADSFREWTKKGKPTSGDVLFTREAPFGEVCLTPSDMEVCLGQRMMLFRPDRDVLSPSYLLYALQSAGVQNDMFSKAGGSTVGHLRVNDVRNLPIPVAPRDVQADLERALSFIDDSISTNQAQLERVSTLKSSLMADLLTGRRRVSIDLPLAAE